MLLENKVNISGGIDEEKTRFVTISEAWSYIYYLYTYNKDTIDEFRAMKDGKGKASGNLFYSSVRSVISENASFNIRNTSKTVDTIDIEGLVYFINKMVTDHATTIQNPLIQHLQSLVRDNKQRISNIKVQSNTAYRSTVLYGDNANDANIKIKII